MITKLRNFATRPFYTTRSFHNVKSKNPDSSGTPFFDQYSAHSPLQISRNRVEENRSRLFFEHPPVPNRIAKYFLLFSIVMTFSSGVKDKIRKRHKT